MLVEKKMAGEGRGEQGGGWPYDMHVITNMAGDNINITRNTQAGQA